MITEQPAPATGAAAQPNPQVPTVAAQPAAVVPVQPAAVPLPTRRAPPTAPGCDRQVGNGRSRYSPAR
jgi:hypothetical protein